MEPRKQTLTAGGTVSNAVEIRLYNAMVGTPFLVKILISLPVM